MSCTSIITHFSVQLQPLHRSCQIIDFAEKMAAEDPAFGSSLQWRAFPRVKKYIFSTPGKPNC